jgi:hypothetical protein
MIPCIFQLFFIQGYLNLTGLDIKGVECQVKLANEVGTENLIKTVIDIFQIYNRDKWLHECNK